MLCGQMIRGKSGCFKYQARQSRRRPFRGVAIALQILIALFACQILDTGLARAQEYKDSDFEIAVFDEDAISLQGADRVLVVEALAALASNFSDNGLVDMELSQKALAIALRLDSLNSSARTTRQFLLNGRKPPPTEFFQQLPPIFQTLWEHSVAMKKSQEPEDQRLYPLLMELALLINPDALPIASVVYAESMDELEGSLPKWADFVPLSEDGKSKSSARGEGILNRGRKTQKKWEAVAAKQEKKAATVAAKVAQALANAQAAEQPTMPVPSGSGSVDDPTSGKSVVRPNAEIAVLAWWRLGRRLPLRLGKVLLEVRDPMPADAGRYAAFSMDISDRPMEVVPMIISPANEAEEYTSWIANTYNIVRRRFEKWPKGKVAMVDFHLQEGQIPPMENRRYMGGSVIGAVLAVESVLTGVQMDPESVFYGAAYSNQKIDEGYGYLGEAVNIARDEGYRLIIVPEDMERVMLDWIAMGDIDRLMNPQIVMASNIDELVVAGRSDRPAEVEEAIQLFAEIKDIKTMSLEEAAQNAVVQQRLQAILDQFPQHLSAKMLLAFGKGEASPKASAGGSVAAIREVVQPFMEQYRESMGGDVEDSETQKEKGKQAEARLAYLRNRVDDDIRDFLAISEKTLSALISYLKTSNKSTSGAMKKREDVEMNLSEFNEIYRPLRDKIAEEWREREAAR